MSNYWKLETQGDPLRAVRNFIAAIWRHAGLDGVFVPLPKLPKNTVHAVIIRHPDELGKVNPILPLMKINIARLIPELLQRNPEKRLAVVLRPCEMRAFVEMAKRSAYAPKDVTTICIDCLGTYPPADFAWRAQRKGSPDKLTQENIQFARQGGLTAYRYRSSCQLCVSPDAEYGDVNIGILGLPARQQILVSSRTDAIADHLALPLLTDGVAPQTLVNQRKHLLAKLAERRNRTHERVIAGLSEILPTDVEGLINLFKECGECQRCMEDCPICSVDFPQKGSDGKYLLPDIRRWLASCDGCGMCEQACPNHHPLSAIFRHIKAQLDAELYPHTGSDFNQVLLCH